MKAGKRVRFGPVTLEIRSQYPLSFHLKQPETWAVIVIVIGLLYAAIVGDWIF